MRAAICSALCLEVRYACGDPHVAAIFSSGVRHDEKYHVRMCQIAGTLVDLTFDRGGSRWLFC